MVMYIGATFISSHTMAKNYGEYALIVEKWKDSEILP